MKKLITLFFIIFSLSIFPSKSDAKDKFMCLKEKNTDNIKFSGHTHENKRKFRNLQIYAGNPRRTRGGPYETSENTKNHRFLGISRKSKGYRTKTHENH